MEGLSATGAELDLNRPFAVSEAEGEDLSGEYSLAVVGSSANGLEVTTSDDLRARYHPPLETLGENAGAVNTSSNVRAKAKFGSRRVEDSAELREASPELESGDFLKIPLRLYLDPAFRSGAGPSSNSSLSASWSDVVRYKSWTIFGPARYPRSPRSPAELGRFIRVVRGGSFSRTGKDGRRSAI